MQNHSCQLKNKNWACIHELKCLLAYKDIETNDSQDKKTLLKKWVNALAEDKSFADIGYDEESRQYSITQKIYNINSLPNKPIEEIGIQEHASETTEEIFDKYEKENWSTKDLVQIIEELENEIKQNP